MFCWKSSSLNLQSQSIGFRITWSKYLPLYMSSNVKKSIFVNSINTMKCIFNRKFFDLCNVNFSMKIVEVIFFDEVNFIFVFFFFFFRWFGSFLFWWVFIWLAKGRLCVFERWSVGWIFSIVHEFFSIIYWQNKISKISKKSYFLTDLIILVK